MHEHVNQGSRVRFDSTLALRADPYRFIGRQCALAGRDLFATRVLLKRTICVTGAAAAEVFYDPERFERAGAAPDLLRATLFGDRGVQTLDGPEHKLRKALFMTVLEPSSIDRLVAIVRRRWREAAEDWAGRDIELYPALQELLTRGVCRWAGVPLGRTEVHERARQLTALFDQTANSLSGHLRSRGARRTLERWLANLVREQRRRSDLPAEPTILQTFASFPDLSGKLLAPRVAAVEILNVLRPIVAVSVFIVFAAHAMHVHASVRQNLLHGSPRYPEWFVQEVRRWYPFFPAVIARVREPGFVWNGQRFDAGMRAILDLYGTNHDPRTWRDADAFRPERFATTSITPFNFVPQGGGDAATNHRCPGEATTVALMHMAVDFLAKELRYEVPPQDLTLDYTRLPALPRDRFVLRCAAQPLVEAPSAEQQEITYGSRATR